MNPIFLLLWYILLGVMFFSSCGSSTSDNSSTAVTTTSLFERTDIEGDLQPLLPFTSGSTFKMIQGYGGTFSHYEQCYYYAQDFDLPENTNVVSVADGRVIYLKEDSTINGATLDYWDDSNYVMVDHGFGNYSLYVHLCPNCVEVEVGDKVEQGQTIARSGNTGYSIWPHLHFEMRSWDTHCSVPYGFYDVTDAGGITVTDTSYTSANDGSSEVNYTPSDIPKNYFSTNGIVLTESLPWILTRGTTYDTAGTVSNGKPYAFIYLVTSAGVWVDGTSTSVLSDGTFSLSYTVSSDVPPGLNYIILTTSDTESYYYSTYSEYAWVD